MAEPEHLKACLSNGDRWFVLSCFGPKVACALGSNFTLPSPSVSSFPAHTRAAVPFPFPLPLVRLQERAVLITGSTQQVVAGCQVLVCLYMCIYLLYMCIYLLYMCIYLDAYDVCMWVCVHGPPTLYCVPIANLPLLSCFLARSPPRTLARAHFS